MCVPELRPRLEKRDIREVQKFTSEQEEILMRVVKRDAEKVIQEVAQISQSSRIERFTSFADLKQRYLETESNMIEVNQWIRQVTNYINAEFR